MPDSAETITIAQTDITTLVDIAVATGKVIQASDRAGRLPDLLDDLAALISTPFELTAQGQQAATLDDDDIGMADYRALAIDEAAVRLFVAAIRHTTGHRSDTLWDTLNELEQAVDRFA